MQMPPRKPKLMLLGGDGGRSGVPRFIEQLSECLLPMADISVASDIDTGGFGFTQRLGLDHAQIPGLASSLSPLAVTRAAFALGRFLDSRKPDVIWAHARLTLPLARLLATRRRGATLIATYHGIPFGPGRRTLGSALSRTIDYAFLRMAIPHHLHFLTDEDRLAYAPRILRRHQVDILPNCSDLGGFTAQAAVEGPRRLVMITRDARQKNLDAAARLFAELPLDMELHLYGIGTDSAALRSRFAALMPDSALSRVAFNGASDNLRPVLATADALLVTSRYEGLSIGMIEAMEYGLPIATTPVGGSALIARAHPMLCLIDPQTDAGCKAAAASIDQITARFRANRPALSQAIHEAWSLQFAPEAWQTSVQRLFATITAQQDTVR